VIPDTVAPRQGGVFGPTRRSLPWSGRLNPLMTAGKSLIHFFTIYFEIKHFLFYAWYFHLCFESGNADPKFLTDPVWLDRN
jgi:hypothetical protein